MRKSLPLLLLIFSFPLLLNGIGITNSFFIQTSQEVYNQGFNVPDSIIIDKPKITTENQVNNLVKTDLSKKLKTIQQADTNEISKDTIIVIKSELQKDPEIQKSKAKPEFFIKIPLWLIVLLGFFVIYTIFISLKFFSIYFQEVSTQEQLEIIGHDFESYKKNTIEKERKLLRELIDTKNEIQELKKELKKELNIK